MPKRLCNPQFIFFLKGEKVSHPHTYKTTVETYGFVFFDLYIFRLVTGKQ
jgi:hypothetical protein